MPRFALQNKLYCGSLPQQFKDLTWVEEMIWLMRIWSPSRGLAPRRRYDITGIVDWIYIPSEIHEKNSEFIIQFYSNINVVSMARIRGTRFINHRTFSSQDFFHCEVIYSFVTFSDGLLLLL